VSRSGDPSLPEPVATRTGAFNGLVFYREDPVESRAHREDGKGAKRRANCRTALIIEVMRRVLCILPAGTLLFFAPFESSR
jgi:hypothetical protein